MVFMGETTLSKEDVKQVLRQLAQEYPGNSYDLLRRNCCHFSDDFCHRLGVGPIPPWVNHLACTGASVDDMVKGAESAVQAKMTELAEEAKTRTLEVHSQLQSRTLEVHSQLQSRTLEVHSQLQSKASDIKLRIDSETARVSQETAEYWRQFDTLSPKSRSSSSKPSFPSTSTSAPVDIGGSLLLAGAEGLDKAEAAVSIAKLKTAELNNQIADLWETKASEFRESFEATRRDVQAKTEDFQSDPIGHVTTAAQDVARQTQATLDAIKNASTLDDFVRSFHGTPPRS